MIIESRGNANDGRTNLKGEITRICTLLTPYFLSLSLSYCLHALAEWRPCYLLDDLIEMNEIKAFL